MNQYIMFCFIEEVGGGQTYVDAKTRYLKNLGWNVSIFAPLILANDISPWPDLQEYMNNRSVSFRFAPEFWPRWYVKKTLDFMKDKIGNIEGQVIIETHTDCFAEWGELLAQEIHAKHFCFLLEENLEMSKAKEFLYFKYLRREVAGIHKSSLHKLFMGYKDVPESDQYVLRAAHDELVYDIQCSQLEKISRRDWNIAYIGRDKQYTKTIVEAIADFSQMYSKKTINFLIMGEIKDTEVLNKFSNLHVEKLGFMTPMPKSFFEFVDVVIAGAGCASIAAMQNVPTILANAGTCQAGGILGYDIKDNLFPMTNYKYEELLKKVLVEHVTTGTQPILSNQLYEKPEECYDRHFDFIRRSNQDFVYFDFDKHPQNNKSIRNIGAFVIWKMSHIVSKKMKRENFGDKA